MITIKKQLKKFIGLFSIGILVAGVGMFIKGAKEEKVVPNYFGLSSKSENQDSLSAGIETAGENCDGILEQDSNSLALREQTEDSSECFFVGCGGIF